METIYIDSLFFLNLIIDYLLLLVTGRICSARLRRGFIALGACIGAVYSVMVVFPRMGFLAQLPCKAVFAAAMVLAAYRNEKHLMRCFIVFLAVSAAFAGAVYAVSGFGGTGPGKGLFVRVSPKVLLLSFAVCHCVLSLVFRRSADKAEREKVKVYITLGDSSIELTALSDTGNGLYDPISGCAVCICQGTQLAGLFPEECRGHLGQADALEMFRLLSETEFCRGRFRLVPYSSLGSPSGLLPAFRPDSISINGKPCPSLMVAVTPMKLCADGEYSAIV